MSQGKLLVALEKLFAEVDKAMDSSERGSKSLEDLSADVLKSCREYRLDVAKARQEQITERCTVCEMEWLCPECCGIPMGDA